MHNNYGELYNEGSEAFRRVSYSAGLPGELWVSAILLSG